MNNMQQSAIFHVNGPLLILAGAGSGKTTVIVNRIANMLTYGDAYSSDFIGELADSDIIKIKNYIEQNCNIDTDTKNLLAINKVNPCQILAITFTNKAANELKERLYSKLGNCANDIWASTFHSTCSRILRAHAEKLGYSNHFTIYDTEDSKRLVKDCQKSLNIDDRILSYRSIISEISHAKDNYLSSQEFKNNVGNDFRLQKISEVYSLYQNKLQEADAMDFDDLVLNTVKLFKLFPEVLEYYQNKFKYILVDEYQDTNHIQYMFINLLAKKYKNLCVVGDDDQSIYKFRGATIENIMNFEKNYPEAMVIRLEQNYRSTKNILNAANAVIANNVNRKGKNLWTNNDAGDKINVHTAYNEHDEANYITNVILDEVSRGRKYSDFAVLYRMNTQSNILEKTFVKSGIPYRIIGGFRFYERKEIKDMIAYLNVINNPSDEIRLRRIINYPKRSIGEKTINTAMELAHQHQTSILEIIKRANEFEDLKRSSSKLMEFSILIENLIEASKKLSLSELYNLLLEKTNYIKALKEDKENNEDRVENIRELASNIIKYEQENGESANLPGFLEEVSLMTDIDNYDSKSDSVVMMTIHSAKGLEFPVIFLPGFEEGIFPGIQATYNQSEVDEERRLAYVGITRAKEKLYILNTDSRMLYGSTSRNKISRFTQEIPSELINKTRARDWKKLEPGTVVSKSLYETRIQSAQSARNFGQGVIHQEIDHQTYNIGDIVTHKTFGQGIIISVKPMGNDNLLEINFDNIGSKKLMSNYAKLSKNS